MGQPIKALRVIDVEVHYDVLLVDTDGPPEYVEPFVEPTENRQEEHSALGGKQPTEKTPPKYYFVFCVVFF
jgi:hypothetical protein